MDLAKNIGKIKEQVSQEQKARRNYPVKWGKISDPELYRFYHPNEISKQLKEQLKLQDLCPYVHTNKGESFFISPEMHQALVSNCRCGRLRTDLHMTKCLQKAVNPYLDDPKGKTADITNKIREKRLPPTSNSAVGWMLDTPSYYKLEQSMKYISPVYSMPGPRITETPYKVLFIG